jgi:hypothetical protein
VNVNCCCAGLLQFFQQVFGLEALGVEDRQRQRSYRLPGLDKLDKTDITWKRGAVGRTQSPQFTARCFVFVLCLVCW